MILFICSLIRPAGIVLIVLILLPGVLAAQTSMEGGARAAALGGAQTALVQDDAGYANPASWATLSGRSVSFFATQAFALPELRLGATHYVEPTRFGTVAMGARTFGFEDYRETRLHAGYALQVHPGTTRSLLLGIRLAYHSVTITRYGTTATLGMALGLLARLQPSVYVGFQAHNLHTPRLAGRDALPRSIAIGLSYEPHPAIRLLADIYKDVRFPPSIRTGTELQMVPAFTIRIGAATEPARITAGAGLRFGRLAADIAAEHHVVLGWSPAVSMGLRW